MSGWEIVGAIAVGFTVTAIAAEVRDQLRAHRQRKAERAELLARLAKAEGLEVHIQQAMALAEAHADFALWEIEAFS